MGVLPIEICIPEGNLSRLEYSASTETVPMRCREKVGPAIPDKLTPGEELCDQQIIASPLITLHSPRTTTLQQIP